MKNRLLANPFCALLGATGCLLLAPATALPEEGEKAEVERKVAALIAQRDEDVSIKLAALREPYVNGLEKFRLDWVAADRIDDALAALELKSALEEHSSFDPLAEKLDSLPPELRRVVDTWNSARAGYVEASTAIVREKLASWRTQAVADGDLDAAKALDRHLALLQDSDAPPMASSSSGPGAPEKIEGAEELPPGWIWGSGGTLQLLSDGTAIHSRWRGQPGSWEWTRQRRIALHNPITNEVSEIRLNQDGSGQVTAPGGGTTTLTPLDKAP